MTDETSPNEPKETSARADASAAIDPRMLETLICPVSRTMLVYDRARAELISRKAGLAFPIRNGVPIMLEGEARSLDEG